MFFKFLSKDYPIEKAFFIVSRLCLSWMGEFPQSYSTTARTLNFSCHCAILFAGVIGQFGYGFYYIRENLQIGLDAICPAVSCLVAFTKMVLIFWYGKELSFVIKHLQVLFFAEKNEENQDIAKRFSATATNLSFMFAITGSVASTFYGLRPLVTNSIRLILGMEYIFDDTSLRVLIPTVTLRLPWYPLTYSLITYMGTMTGIIFVGVGSFYTSFCLSSTALFKMLQTDIRLTLEQFQTKTKLTKEENNICCNRLGQIVQRHNEIIDLVNQFCGFFTVTLLIQFVTSSMVIGASIIEILLFPGIRAIVYVTYTLAALYELFIYCYGASEITESSTELGTAAYFSNWYNCDARVQKMILMIIIRSQRPVTMDVPFFSPSLETFMSIIQTAGSVITLVKSVL